MADAGVARDPGRLPWLEPYRAPQRKPSNRRAGLTAAFGAIGLTAVVALLTRGPLPFPAEDARSEATVTLPPPEELQPQIVLPPLDIGDEPEEAQVQVAAAVRPATKPRRRIRAVPTSAAYREVVDHQTGAAPHAPDVALSNAALAIAAIPLPPDPPRPAVNPAAELVKGKTVQLGVYKTAAQAEAAWRSAIRDYTFLVTMPKSIEPITIRSIRFYRLQLGTPSKKHARQLCSNLKSIGRACTVA